LNSLSTWASDWCVNFNASKTKPMLFTRKHDVNIPPLYMNDDVLEDVLKHKHLGIHFCPNGTWKDHINGIEINTPIGCPSTKVIQIRIQGFSGFILIINNTIKGCIVSK
jgi:hypothetical protein